MKHWLKLLLPKNEIAVDIAQKIEDADERISNLKKQIVAVQDRRSELAEKARELASECVDERELDRLIAGSEAPLLQDCAESALILQTELRRLFVEASPFLSELAQTELEKVNAVQGNVKRWISRI